MNMGKDTGAMKNMMNMMMMSQMFGGNNGSNGMNPMMFMMMGKDNPFTNMFEGAFDFGLPNADTAEEE